MGFKLPSSNKILVKYGKINEKNLYHLIKEAFFKRNLYAECDIYFIRKTRGGFPEKRQSFATYKELWDCYRSLTGKEDYHPYDKENQHPFSLAEYFVFEKKTERFFDLVEFIGNLSVGDFKFIEKEKKEEFGKEMMYEKELTPVIKEPLKRGRKKKQEVSLIENHQNI